MNVMPQKHGLMLAAPSSGSGKTVLQLALLRAFRVRGVEISAAKAGPDFIDPGFHQIACGTASVNLDPWEWMKSASGLWPGRNPAATF